MDTSFWGIFVLLCKIFFGIVVMAGLMFFTLLLISAVLGLANKIMEYFINRGDKGGKSKDI